MRMQLLQLVDVRVEEVSRPLREEVAALKLLLVRAGDSLEPTEACTSGVLGIALAQASLLLDSTQVEEDHLHGCFSPRGCPCTSPQPASKSDGMGEILAPLLQITPELNELCGDPPMVVVSTTPSPPCQTLAHVDSGGLDASDSLPSMDIGHVVSLSDEIAEIGVLAPNSETLFAKELSD
jgi:hypothetical protein